jgi:hypothetical protein
MSDSKQQPDSHQVAPSSASNRSESALTGAPRPRTAHHDWNQKSLPPVTGSPGSSSTHPGPVVSQYPSLPAPRREQMLPSVSQLLISTEVDPRWDRPSYPSADPVSSRPYPGEGEARPTLPNPSLRHPNSISPNPAAFSRHQPPFHSSQYAPSQTPPTAYTSPQGRPYDTQPSSVSHEYSAERKGFAPINPSPVGSGHSDHINPPRPSPAQQAWPSDHSPRGSGSQAPTPSLQADGSRQDDTSKQGPLIWTGSYFLPRFLKQEHVPGEGLCYFYDDGSHCKAFIDGEPVTAHWGVTKAGKPRKRLAVACMTCREKKIKCDPDFPKCVQCDKFGRDCHFKNAYVSFGINVLGINMAYKNRANNLEY